MNGLTIFILCLALLIILYFFIKFLFKKKITGNAVIKDKYSIERNITGQYNGSFIYIFIFSINECEYKVNVNYVTYISNEIGDEGLVKLKGNKLISFKKKEIENV